MDLAVLILLNLVFLVVFYVLFSIRMGRAIEKTRKAGIPREFYQNVEMVIQYLDATLESINQKNDSLYKMLLRAETLKGELESLLDRREAIDRAERSPPSGRRKSRKSAPLSEAAEGAKPVRTADPGGGLARVASALPGGASLSSASGSETSRRRPPSAGDAALERLLEQAGPDHVRWTESEAELPELIGARANRSGPGPSVSMQGIPDANPGRMPPVGPGGTSMGPAVTNPLNGVFAGIGRLARRVLGEPPARDREGDDGSRQGAATVANHIPPSPGSQSPISFEEQLYGYAPSRRPQSRPARPDRGGLVDETADETADRGTAGLLLRAVESEGESTAALEQTEVDEAYFPNGILDHRSGDERLAEAGMPFPEVPDLTRPGDRATFVKELLRRGLGIQEIAVTTGISYQEIELIEKVMQTGADRSARGSRRGLSQRRSGP